MVRLLCYLSISMVCCWARGAVGETESQQVLRGERVAVEVAIKDGRLRERYLAIRNGAWVEVASSDPAHTLGPVSVISGGKPLDGSVQRISLRNGTLTEELALGDHRVIRKLTIQGEGPWIRVVTRLQPSGQLSLHQLSDRLRFPQRADWSYSPSVGGFNPDAQYKAPLALALKQAYPPCDLAAET